MSKVTFRPQVLSVGELYEAGKVFPGSEGGSGTIAGTHIFDQLRILEKEVILKDSHSFFEHNVSVSFLTIRCR